MISSFQVAGSLFPEITRLQQQLEEIFMPGPQASIRALARGAFPAINVGRTDDSIEVVAFVPGIEPNELELTVERGLLSLSGERRSDSSQSQDKSDAYAQERFSGKFRRVISLPEDADPTKVQANFRDGVLHVSVAKSESSKPRQIKIG